MGPTTRRNPKHPSILTDYFLLPSQKKSPKLSNKSFFGGTATGGCDYTGKAPKKSNYSFSLFSSSPSFYSFLAYSMVNY
jgi:hypothetical protein